MRIIALLGLVHLSHEFSIDSFYDVPQELIDFLEGHEDYGLYTVKVGEEDNTNFTDYTFNNTSYGQYSDEDEEELDYSTCPMDKHQNDTYQMKMYWEKGTEWQGSKKEMKFCAECEHKCREKELIKLRTCDDREEKQQWIFHNCTVRPARNPDICITTGVKQKKSRDEEKIQLRPCGEKNLLPEQMFRMYDPEDIFEKFQFKLLGKKNKDICLSQEHHPRSGEALRFFSCKRAYLNDGGRKKKDDTSHWVVGEFDDRKLRGNSKSN